mmetsp:Transcript_81178/g.140580  ORF Transcript_81178/g.140580 Transcript_81178/m.140580 type:complete len:87 (-) Transcript_81178:1483-1743(-)
MVGDDKPWQGIGGAFLALGITQGSGSQEKLGGMKFDLLQSSAATLGEKPASHCVVHAVSCSIWEPSLQGFDASLIVGESHGASSQT